MDNAPRAPFLQRPLHSLGAWVDFFRKQDIPVLATSAEALEDLRANEDDVDAHLIGETFANDPLMTLKVLIAAAKLNRERRSSDVDTITSAVVMMGITPFFNTFGPQPTLEDWLTGEADALDGVDAVLARSERASRFALGFAAHRLDPQANVIHGAALLHDFAELLLWCHAPALAHTIRLRQRMDSTLRSPAAQRDVLGIDLMSLEKELMRAWHLPRLMLKLMDEQETRDPQERCVLLATRTARHSMGGWDNAALPDDLAEIGVLLNLGPAPTLRLLHDLAGDARVPLDSQIS